MKGSNSTVWVRKVDRMCEECEKCFQKWLHEVKQRFHSSLLKPGLGPAPAGRCFQWWENYVVGGNRGRPGSPGCHEESEARMVKVNLIEKGVQFITFLVMKFTTQHVLY